MLPDAPGLHSSRMASLQIDIWKEKKYYFLGYLNSEVNKNR
jgi:hypothetical protein